MSLVWIYTVGANSDPDKVHCKVPWRVDEELIFFGPCKKRMREKLRKEYLRPDRPHRLVSDEVFIVGVNSGNSAGVRKVIWAEIVAELMTFAYAHKRLAGRKFKAMRDHPCSPLHVSAISKDGVLVGYQRRSQLHKKVWVSDLASSRRGIKQKGQKVFARANTVPWEVFNRDCCMLLTSVFFAQGEGIAFDREALNILKQAQPEKSEIDRFAIFGYTADGQVNGLRGNWLEIEESMSSRFVAWLVSHAGKKSRRPTASTADPNSNRCDPHSGAHRGRASPNMQGRSLG